MCQTADEDVDYELFLFVCKLFLVVFYF